MNVPNEGSGHNRLESARFAAMISALVGAVGSVGLMLGAGFHPPVLLVALFIVWVSAPFLAVIVAIYLSRNWRNSVRRALYAITPVLTLVSLAIYGYGMAWPLASQPAFPYVALPIASWLLLAVALGGARIFDRGPKSLPPKRETAGPP
jgi:hypothetical protein